MTLPTRTLVDDPNEHLADHNLLHTDYNGGLADRGIVYVADDGSDGNAGRSWTLPKATVAGAQAAGGNPAVIKIGPGSYDINEPIELQDGQLIVGASPHTFFGTVLQATATLGTDPVLVNSAFNLTSGGLKSLQLNGTGDGLGGVGMLIEVGSIADGWTMDFVRAQAFGSHGFHFDIPSGDIAGNPGFFGVVDAFGNGGHGFLIARATSGTIRFASLGGDDNGGSLLYLDILNDQALVRVDNLKSERATDGTHDDIVTVNNANGGALSIGGFRVFHNVSGGTDGNALIRNTGDATLLFYVDHVFASTYGSNVYTYGFTNGTNSISYSDFIRHPWVWNSSGTGRYLGVRDFVGVGSPEGVKSAPVGSTYRRTNGGAGTSFYVKESGTGNTGWVGK